MHFWPRLWICAYLGHLKFRGFQFPTQSIYSGPLQIQLRLPFLGNTRSTLFVWYLPQAPLLFPPHSPLPHPDYPAGIHAREYGPEQAWRYPGINLPNPYPWRRCFSASIKNCYSSMILPSLASWQPAIVSWKLAENTRLLGWRQRISLLMAQLAHYASMFILGSLSLKFHKAYTEQPR